MFTNLSVRIGLSFKKQLTSQNPTFVEILVVYTTACPPGGMALTSLLYFNKTFHSEYMNERTNK